MIVPKEPELLALDVFGKQPHHINRFFRRILGRDHHVHRPVIGLAFQVAAITVNRRQHDQRSNGHRGPDRRAHAAGGTQRAHQRHDIHRQEFLPVAPVLHVTVTPHHVRQLMRNDRRQLRFIVDQREQSGRHVDRSVRQCQRVRLGVAQGAKLPTYVFEDEAFGNQRSSDSKKIRIRRFVLEH